jgi:hypothetical protein
MSDQTLLGSQSSSEFGLFVFLGIGFLVLGVLPDPHRDISTDRRSYETPSNHFVRDTLV